MDYIEKFSAFEAKKKEEKKKESYDYGCMMIYFNFEEMKSLHNQIDPDDIYIDEDDDSYGLEKEPHVTLLYGLHSDEINDEDVMKAVEKKDIEKLVLHNISSFSNEKYDVLKFDVKGEGLKEANKALKKFPYTSDFPRYHPHSTIAYLKPGKAKKYIEMWKDEEHEVYPRYLVYSKPAEKEGEKKPKVKEKF